MDINIDSLAEFAAGSYAPRLELAHAQYYSWTPETPRRCSEPLSRHGRHRQW